MSDKYQALIDSLRDHQNGGRRNECDEAARAIETLRAANARLQAWHDAVMGQMQAFAPMEEMARLRAELVAPGIMRCAKCSFGLQRVSLNVNNGTVSAGDSKTEMCPNGCGPLWPVTWKELSAEHLKAAERFFDEAAAERKDADKLRAANARLQAWHDAVVAARVVDAVDIGTAAMVLRQANGRILELQDAVDEIERRSVKAIIRPQPLAKE